MWRRISAAATLSLLVSAPLHAAPILFLDRGTFLDATEPNQAIPFGGSSIQGCEPFIFPVCHRTFEGIFHVAYDFAGIGLFGPNLGLGRINSQLSGNEFLEPISAVGFDLVGIFVDGNFSPSNPPPPTANFAFAGTTFVLPQQFDPIFFGAIFDTPIPQNGPLPANAFGGYAGPIGGFVITNLVVQTVPEPATLLLFGTAAAAILGSRRRLRSKDS